MASNSLLQQVATMKQSLLDQGIVDTQFIVVENLSCHDDPNFAEDLFNSYFEETKTRLSTVEEELAKTPVDYSTLRTLLFKLKGISATVGANKVLIEVNAAIECCHQENIEGAKAAFERLKGEIDTLKAKIDPYFQLVKQAKESDQKVDDPK